MKNKRIFWACVMVAVLLQVAGGLVIYLSLDSWASRSAFGDMFGPIASLFSGLALAGLVWSILLQQSQLEIQQEQLELARDEMKQIARSQAKTEEALNEQTKALAHTAALNALAFVPVFDLEYRPNDTGEVSLTVRNLGTTLAQDVSILAIGCYHVEDCPIPVLLGSRANAEELSWLSLEPTDEGFYGVRDRLYYPVIPLRTRVDAGLLIPRAHLVGLHTLVEFRDIQGSNYHRLLWHFVQDDDRSHFTLGSVHPDHIAETARIRWDENGLPQDEEAPLPHYLAEYTEMWNASVFCTKLALAHSRWEGVEGRGVFSEL